MKKFYSQKKKHQLHLAKSAVEFIEAFQHACGCHPLDLLPPNLEQSKLKFFGLGGSVPLGTANESSDVDLIVVIDRWELPVANDNTSDSLHFTHEDNTLVLSGVNAIIDGVEVDMVFIDAVKMEQCFKRIEQGGARLSSMEIMYLGRIQSAWSLLPTAERELVSVSTATRLAVQVSTQYFVDSLKLLEDAATERNRDLFLSCYLASLAVEKGFRSILASEGHVGLGPKWPRLTVRSAGDDSQNDVKLELLNRGRCLLSTPSIHDQRSIDIYFSEVSEVIFQFRDAICKNRRFEIAFNICPQIYGPDNAPWLS